MKILIDLGFCAFLQRVDDLHTLTFHMIETLRTVEEQVSSVTFVDTQTFKDNLNKTTKQITLSYQSTN